MQGSGELYINEDFHSAIAQTLTDATQYQFNQVRLAAISGNVAMDIDITSGNGVATFSGAGGATDGVSIFCLPLQPTTNGTLAMEVRFKSSAFTSYGAFIGFQETVALAEPVNPFTLSGTTLTANNGGQVWGIYYDTAATTDDWRVMASSDGTALTSAAVTNNLTGAKTTLGSLGVRVGLSSAPTAAKWMRVRAELDPDGAARVYYQDILTDPSGTGPRLIASLDPGILDATAFYHPIATLVDPSTNDPLHSVDYFRVRAYRDWSY